MNASDELDTAPTRNMDLLKEPLEKKVIAKFLFSCVAINVLFVLSIQLLSIYLPYLGIYFFQSST